MIITEKTLPPTKPNGALPNTAASTKSIKASTGAAASAGAACHGHGVDVSTVLKAMNVPTDYAMGTVRLSVGRPTTMAEIDAAIRILIEAVRHSRN